jgi:hypothetical protein
MRLDPNVLQCDCGSHVLMVGDLRAGYFTCPNPVCANFEKVFKPVEIKPVKAPKTYRELVAGQ